MRISTNTMFRMGSSRLSELQSSLIKNQQQLSTQKRVLSPADDPVAAASALVVTQSLSMNEQQSVNRQSATSALSEEESVLQNVTSLYQDVKALIVNAGNGAMEDEQRQYLAAELKGRFDELMSLANSRDGNGDYMFGGYKIDSQPFSKVATGAQYSGDQGQRFLQVSTSRQVPLNDSGTTVFEMNKTGNGTFVTQAGAANTGSGIVGTGSVTNGTALTGNSYSIDFNVAPGATLGGTNTTYTVKNNTTGFYMDPATGLFNVAGPLPAAPAGPRVAYVSGQAIGFDGMQLDIQGAPATGDTFNVDPSGKQSIFTTLQNLLNTLNSTGEGATGQANLTNGLNTANNQIDNALDNILDVRASLGTHMKELDILSSTGDDLKIQYTTTLSNLQDVDLTKAISDFTQQQQIYSAAQQSFVKISGLSLFNYL